MMTPSNSKSSHRNGPYYVTNLVRNFFQESLFHIVSLKLSVINYWGYIKFFHITSQTSDKYLLTKTIQSIHVFQSQTIKNLILIFSKTFLSKNLKWLTENRFLGILSLYHKFDHRHGSVRYIRSRYWVAHVELTIMYMSITINDLNSDKKNE